MKLAALVFTASLGVALPGLARADLEIVASVPDLAAIATEIGGPDANVMALSLATQDPHWVDAKPSLALGVNKADMLLAVGLSLEIGWLPTLQTGARNGKVTPGGDGYLECGRHVSLLEVTRSVDRSQGDVHPGGNPHYLYDPRRALQCARAVAAKMAALDPENAAGYRSRLADFERRLESKMAEWERRLKPARGAKVLSYHRSWVYLADWLGLEIVAELEPKPGVPPSPRHVARVIAKARSAGVRALLQEGYYPSKTSALVAKKLGVPLVSIHGGTDFRKGETYIDHIDEMVAALEKALK